MYDFLFRSAFPYHVVQVLFLILGIYILVKKQLPGWLSKEVSGSKSKVIGWILVSVVPLSLSIGALLSVVEAWDLLLYLDPVLILVPAIIILFMVNQDKRRSVSP